MTVRGLTCSRACRGLQLLQNLIHPLQENNRKFVSRSFASDTVAGDDGCPKLESEVTPPEDGKTSEDLDGKHAFDVDTKQVSDAEDDSNSISEQSEYEASIKVSAPLVGLVAGRRGIRRNAIEKATQAHIHIPPLREVKEVRSSVPLVVKGPSEKAVDAAITRIKTILRRAEKNPSLEYSHFISVPLASHKHLVDKVRSFRQTVLADEKEANTYVSWFPEGDVKDSSEMAFMDTKKTSKAKTSQIVDPDLEGLFSDDESSDDEDERIPNSGRSRIKRTFFVRPETFHLTVLMLKLFTEQSVNLAAEVLQGVQSEVLEVLNGSQPKVRLQGIECLKGNPAEARVLCMRVHEINPDRPFHQACHVIKNAFIKAGLVTGWDRTQDLKLHATLMNANYSPRLKARSFDARNVLAKHWREDWGEYTINEVHLSQRFFYDPNGYYRCCGSLEVPSTSSELVQEA